jgi:hypothetical protein
VLEPWPYVAKVCDFGLSVKTAPAQQHVSNLRHGTPFYIAPEVSRAGHLSMAADSHAFGAPRVRLDVRACSCRACKDGHAITHILSIGLRSSMRECISSPSVGDRWSSARAGVMMWECFHSCAPYQKDAAGRWVTRPEFPRFPPDCPLSFALLAISCLTPNPLDRPNFWQIVGVLADLRRYLRGAATHDTAAAHATLVEIESPGRHERGTPSDRGAWAAGAPPAPAQPPAPGGAGAAGAEGVTHSMRSMQQILLRAGTPPALSAEAVASSVPHDEPTPQARARSLTPCRAIARAQHILR